MAKLPWWPFYGRDFFGDEKVKLMSNAQIGMYVKLLDHQWNEGSIPLNIGFGAFMDLHHQLHDSKLAEQEFSEVLTQCFSPHPTIERRMYNVKMEEVRQEQIKKDEVNQERARKAGIASSRAHRARSKSTPSQQSQSQSQSQKKTQNQKKKESQNLKTAGTEEDLVPAVNGIATWESYSRAYFARYGVQPVRNKTINSQLKQIAERLGQDEAPLVAAFYVTHNKPLYVTNRHPTNLLLRDAEGLRTEWATGVKATTREGRNAELQDNVLEQVQRVRNQLMGGT